MIYLVLYVFISIWVPFDEDEIAPIRECKVSARTSDLRGLQVFCIARIILLLYRVHSDFLYVFALGGRTCCSPTKLCV